MIFGRTKPAWIFFLAVSISLSACWSYNSLMQVSLDSLANPTNHLDNWSAFGDLTNVWQPSSHNLWNLGKSGNISHPSPRVEIRASEHLSAEFGKIPPPRQKNKSFGAKPQFCSNSIFEDFCDRPTPSQKGRNRPKCPFPWRRAAQISATCSSKWSVQPVRMDHWTSFDRRFRWPENLFWNINWTWTSCQSVHVTF